MRRYYVYNSFFSLLLALVSFTSCTGQVQSHQPNDGTIESKKIAVGQPKLIKTQGTNQYANIRCGLQDKAGNLWFGTTGEGVYRYDGKLFIQFTVKDGLSNNVVYSIAEDEAGNIWFGTDNGISRYDGKAFTSVPISLSNNTYISVPGSSSSPPSAKNEVWSIMQDKSGKLWFGTRDGVYCYNGTSFTRFLDERVINKEGLHLKMVNCIIEDKYGDIWFGSGMPPGGEGVCYYNGKSITSFKPNGDGWIRYMVEDKNGIIWLSTRHNGNWCYDGKVFTKYNEKVGIGAAILVDRAGNIWFSGVEHENGFEGVGGVWRYDGKSFKNFTTNDGIGKYGVWSIIEDRAGNIWFGTRKTSLYRYNGETFTNFSE